MFVFRMNKNKRKIEKLKEKSLNLLALEFLDFFFKGECIINNNN